MLKVKENSFIEILERSIINIENINNGEIINENLKIHYFKNKYSNLESESLILFYKDEPIKTRKYKVSYKCECGFLNKIHLSKFLNKKNMRCAKCKETEEKKLKHSKLLSDKNFKRKIKKQFIYNLETHIEDSLTKFSSESPNFVKKYYEKKITSDEFIRLIDKIVSVNGVYIKDKDVRFIPTLTVKNQSKYSQYIIYENEKILLDNIEFKCENCGDNFNTTRKPKEKIKNYRILCSSCTFCNKTFKKRKYKTIFNDHILYQSLVELDFIKKCENKGIKILNGEKIKYLFDGKEKKYSIDFYLPEHNYQIEIKGNHIWHRTQINNGIWFEKQKSAEKFCEINNLKYVLLFQEQMNDFLESIKI
jgi:hypothetical protein